MGSDGAGPYTAPDWASIAPGEIRLLDDGGPQTVDPNGGDPAVGATFNPLGATACSAAPGAEEPGTANYELPAAPAGGYTVMGAATVIANINLPGDNSQIAARLVDVSPDGTTKTLVERGLWRPRKQGPQVFQLFANGWKVEEGHVLRLELLPRDAAQKTPGGFLSNYGRPSNGQQAATIDNVDLRVPELPRASRLSARLKVRRHSFEADLYYPLLALTTNGRVRAWIFAQVFTGQAERMITFADHVNHGYLGLAFQ